MKRKKYFLLEVLLLLTLVCTVTAHAQTIQTVLASVFVNGKQLNSDAYIINDRTYVPLRAVSETMGAAVSWDGESKSAYVDFSTSEDNATTAVIKEVSPSVVAIVGSYKSEHMSNEALSYNDTYGHGAGVIIKSNGTILTNAHVVKDLSNLTVIFGNGENYSGTVSYIDETSDLAIVKINKLGLKPITFGTKEDIVVGRTVIAIGTPVSLNMLNSASKGIISGKNVNIGEYYYFTQSDVAINGGNSGGPLITLDGKLIGINSSKYAGVGIEGMSFSIPIDTVNYILNQFETNKKVLRPDIGATFVESWAAKLGVPTTDGITVSKSSIPELLVNDNIIAVNGVTVNNITDYNEVLKNTYNGGDILIKYRRGGIENEIYITPQIKEGI